MVEIVDGALTESEMARYRRGENPFGSPAEFLAGTFALRNHLARTEEGAQAIALSTIDAFVTAADNAGEHGGKVKMGDIVAGLEARLAEINRFNREGGPKKPDELSKGENAFLFHREVLGRMVGGQGMRATASETVGGHAMQMLKHTPGITYTTTPMQRDALALMATIGQQLGAPGHGLGR
jgi:hypothetical protein